jgi:hypothetical protein
MNEPEELGSTYLIREWEDVLSLETPLTVTKKERICSAGRNKVFVCLCVLE